MKKKSLLLIAVFFVSFITLVGCGKKEEKVESKTDYLVLVNKYSQLPDNWESTVELASAKDFEGGDIQVEKKALDEFYKLQDALHKEGIDIVLDSVYRSVSKQQKLWDDWSADPEKGIEYVRKYVAVPGYSEHHTGLAIDIAIKKDGRIIYDNDEMIAEREIFAKVHEKLADYGFILRYLENREDSTGYTYEPWHLRYIDDVKIAKEIMNKNITFEEYLDSIKDVKDNKAAAKYQIEKALQNYFVGVYGDKITNSRFNVTKIYSKDEEKDVPALESLNLGDNKIAFEVTYQLQPRDNTVINELTIPDGEYSDILEWITDISRVGVLSYDKNTDTFSIENFGTGF